MLDPNRPALVLAPMEGITDAPMRAFQGINGAFTYAVSEFLRVSSEPITAKLFRRDVPELETDGRTVTGLPVQVQILGGDAELMAISAAAAVEAGAWGVDINFGCPAKTVNRHDGGASLLRYPHRIYEIVAAVRRSVPAAIPVSAKLRLGWDSIDPIFENAAAAVDAGSSWITIHARTRTQGYLPPVYWSRLGEIRERTRVPVIANGDIWSLDDFRRCRSDTGCMHYMIGRGALANPLLAVQIACELGLMPAQAAPIWRDSDWISVLRDLERFSGTDKAAHPEYLVMRFKQWLKLARNHGCFDHFDAVKQTRTTADFFRALEAELLVVV
jgi:tRNA-dihydrouridine synthase C